MFAAGRSSALTAALTVLIPHFSTAFLFFFQQGEVDFWLLAPLQRYRHTQLFHVLDIPGHICFQYSPRGQLFQAHWLLVPPQSLHRCCKWEKALRLKIIHTVLSCHSRN